MTHVDLNHVQRLYAFHHWATDLVLDSLAAASAAQLDRQWGGSFGTGRALLRHVVGVERLWCDRWSGRSAKALPDYPAAHAGRDFRAEWEKIKDDQQRFIRALTPERLAGDLTYVNIKGETWTYPFADIMLHCANHGTYHRGQLTHLLRDLGLPAPSTDFLNFVDGQRK
ncbi:MAG TPA: DinB family protein [Gemmatimonadaceae bacterium]